MKKAGSWISFWWDGSSKRCLIWWAAGTRDSCGDPYLPATLSDLRFQIWTARFKYPSMWHWRTWKSCKQDDFNNKQIKAQITAASSTGRCQPKAMIGQCFPNVADQHLKIIPKCTPLIKVLTVRPSKLLLDHQPFRTFHHLGRNVLLHGTLSSLRLWSWWRTWIFWILSLSIFYSWSISWTRWRVSSKLNSSMSQM